MEVPLSTPPAARAWAGLLGATSLVVAAGGVRLAWAGVAREPAQAVDGLLAAIAGTVVCVCLAMLGAELLWAALAPPPTLRVSEHHLTLRMPAVLEHPLVVARSRVESLRTVTADVADPGQAAALTPLHTGIFALPSSREVLLAFSDPVVLPVRTTSWLRSRLLLRLADPLPAPGTRVTGLRLSGGEATAADWVAVSAWVPEGAPSAPALAPRRRDRMRTAAVAGITVAAVAVAAWLVVPSLRQVADPGCAGLRVLQEAREPVDSEPVGRKTVGREAGEGETVGGGQLAGLLPRVVATGASSTPMVLAVDATLDAGRAARLDRDPLVEAGRLAAYGFRAGHLREWSGDGIRMLAAVHDLGTAEAALAYDRAQGEAACAFSQRAFAVPAVPGAVGLRVRTLDGSRDRVTFVRGARRYTVAVTVATAPPDHAAVRALALAVSATAR